jgi:cell division protein FtsQ
VWGSDAQSALKAEVLARLLARPAGTYDVSVPGQPVTSVR